MAAAEPIAQDAYAGIVLSVIRATPDHITSLQRPARQARAPYAVVEPMQVCLRFVFEVVKQRLD
jgi:hypothetical protein